MMKNSSDTTESDSAVSLIQQSHYNLFLNLKFAKKYLQNLETEHVSPWILGSIEFESWKKQHQTLWNFIFKLEKTNEKLN